MPATSAASSGKLVVPRGGRADEITWRAGRARRSASAFCSADDSASMGLANTLAGARPFMPPS